MPASKEFKMTFNMSAKADGSFSSTFSKAQQDLARMQQEIQKLNSTQVDISSYQKQQQAIEATTRKLERLKEQQKLLNKQKEEMRAAGQSTTALEREEKKLEQTVDNTNTKLQQQQQKLTQTGERLRQAGVDTSNLTSESKRLEQEMGQLKNEQEKVAEGAQRSGQAMAEAFDAAASAMAAAGIVAGLKQIYDAFKECVQVAAEFEATMSSVEALSGANSEEMAALTARAKELGATTKFTAQESGQAMTYMAMAGWSADEMLQGINGTMYLAAASGEDLALVSDIVTDSMTAFGLSASDAGHYADVLAAAATKSNTNVAMLGETFKYAAPLAGALKYDVEDVAVAAGLMANAGIKGSEAGTTLRNILTRLAKPTKESADAMEALGISLTDDSGHMYSFMEIVEQLRDRFSGLTEEQKTFYAAELAGQRGMSGLLAVVNAAEGDFETLTAAITNSTGAAQRMADIKLDNLAGDITLAQSAAEALKVSIGDALIPVLRGMVQEGTAALNWLNGFASAHPEVIQATAALAAGLGVATAALVAFSAALKVIKALDMEALFATGVGPMVLLAGAFAGLAAVGIAGADAAKAQRGEYYQLTAASQKQYREIQNLNTEYQRATEHKFQDTAETLALRNQIDDLTEAYESNKQTLSSWITENDNLISSVQETMDSYSESMSSLQEESTGVLALSQRLDELAGKSNLTAAEQQQMLSIVNRMNEAVPGLGLAYDKTTGSLNKSTEAIQRAAKAQAKQRYEQEKQEHYVDLLVEQAQLQDQVAEATENLAAAQEYLNSLEGSQGPGSTMEDRQRYQEASEAVRLYSTELADLQGTLDTVNAELSGYDAEMASAASETQTLESATSNLETALETLQSAYLDAYAAARESLEGQYSLWEKADEVTATSMSSLQENLQSQVDYWNNYNTNLETVRQAAENAGVDLSGVWDHLTDGSSEAVNAVAGMASEITSSADGGAAALEGYVNTYQELQDAMGQTAETIATGSEQVQSALDLVRQAVEAGATDLNMSDQFRDAATQTIQGYIDGFGADSGIGTALAGMESELSAGIQGLNKSGEAATAGSDTIQGFVNGVTGAAGQMTTLMSQSADSAINAFKGALGVASPSTITNQAGIDTVQGFVNGVNATAPQGVSAMQNAANSAISAFKSQMSSTTLYSAGQAALQGAINGINSMIPRLVAAARSAGQQAAAAYKAAQQIESPSKVFRYFGEMDIAGVIKGIEGMQDEANRAFASVATGNVKAYQDAVSTQGVAGETVTRLNAAGMSAMDGSGLTEAVVLAPQLIAAMAAYRQAMTRTEAEQIQADRMDRIITAIRDYRGGDDDNRPSPAPIQITFQIQGNPAPETVDRLEDFIYSDSFSERVNEVVGQAQRDAARRAYR